MEFSSFFFLYFINKKKFTSHCLRRRVNIHSQLDLCYNKLTFSPVLIIHILCYVYRFMYKNICCIYEVCIKRYVTKCTHSYSLVLKAHVSLMVEQMMCVKCAQVCAFRRHCGRRTWLHKFKNFRE